MLFNLTKVLRTRQRNWNAKASCYQCVWRMAELKTNEEELSDETIMDIELGLKDVRAGRSLTMSEVKRRMKMK
jgi:hypothetical protein